MKISFSDLQSLVAFAVGQDDRLAAQAGQRGAGALQIQRRDGGIADHQGLPPGQMGPQQVGLPEQIGTNVNRVAAVAEFDMERFHEAGKSGSDSELTGLQAVQDRARHLALRTIIGDDHAVGHGAVKWIALFE